jgi:non-specific serine/threonine protein kinase
VQLLATSRAPIGLAGEQVFEVSPLPLPDLHAPLTVETLAHIESARLFVERATAVNPQFELTEANASVVAHICRQLEGIPLALELAAARTRALPVEEMVQRLDERFRLLTGNNRAAPPRQQTLQATMDWSYNLLAPSERLLLNRLAVFAGGWTLAAAEAVCSDERLPSTEILNGLAYLIDQSLVILDMTPQSGAPRYRMLETIRQYAHEKLQSSGEAVQWNQQHFDFFLHMAPAAEAKLQHDERGAWQKYLNAEHDNFRAALRWIAERGEIEPQLRMVVALIDFWRAQGYWREGRQYLEQALTATGSWDAGLRSHWLAKALFGAGYLAWMQSDYTAARHYLEASVRYWRELGNKGDLAYSLMNLAWVELQTGHYAVGQALAEESVALSREAGNNSVLGFALVYLGGLAFEQGDDVAGNQIFEAVLPVLRAQGDKWNLAAALSWVGRRMYAQGKFQQATSLGEEALAMWRELGEQSGVAWMLHNLGYVAYAQEDFAQAGAYFKESLALWQDAGSPFGILMVLAGFAVLAISTSRLRHATRLFGATSTLLTAIGAKLYPMDQATCERQLAALRARLDAGAFAAAWEDGRTLSLEQAIALAATDG